MKDTIAERLFDSIMEHSGKSRRWTDLPDNRRQRVRMALSAMASHYSDVVEPQEITPPPTGNPPGGPPK